MILNGMRILLHRMVHALGKENLLGINTDCVYTSLSKDEAVERLVGFRFKRAFTYDDIGSLRFVNGKLPLFGRSNDDHHGPPTIPAFLTQNQLYMKDEYDDIEAKKILEEGSPLLVIGKYPGTGKSRLALNWGKSLKGKLLAVCPTNALCDELTKQGHIAITTHMLLGKRPTPGMGDESFKSFAVSEYSAILFEEVFFYPVSQLEWISSFMKQHPDKIFIANGDPAQNEPVG